MSANEDMAAVLCRVVHQLEPGYVMGCDVCLEAAAALVAAGFGSVAAAKADALRDAADEFDWKRNHGWGDVASHVSGYLRARADSTGRVVSPSVETTGSSLDDEGAS